jgi:hypothetical protein
LAGDGRLLTARRLQFLTGLLEWIEIIEELTYGNRRAVPPYRADATAAQPNRYISFFKVC